MRQKRFPKPAPHALAPSVDPAGRAGAKSGSGPFARAELRRRRSAACRHGGGLVALRHGGSCWRLKPPMLALAHRHRYRLRFAAAAAVLVEARLVLARVVLARACGHGLGARGLGLAAVAHRGRRGRAKRPRCSSCTGGRGGRGRQSAVFLQRGYGGAAELDQRRVRNAPRGLR